VTWGQAQFALGVGDDGIVAEVPPIAKWALGQDQGRVAGWFRAKGATFAPLDEPHKPRVMGGEAGDLWWCETCHARHTLADVAACRRGDPVEVPRKPLVDGDVRWGPGQKYLEVLRGGQCERLHREPLVPG
jgi:hypothetical protein